MRVRGAGDITEAKFTKVKDFQSRNHSTDAIYITTGVSESGQKRIARCPSWAEWERVKRAKALKRRTKAKSAEVREKSAAKKAAIEKNIIRKGQQTAVANEVDLHRLPALEILVQAQGRGINSLRKIVRKQDKAIGLLTDIVEVLQERLDTNGQTDPADELFSQDTSDDMFSAELSQIPEDAPIKPWWPWGRK